MKRQLVIAALGLWLLVAPSVLGVGGVARGNAQVMGLIVAALALVGLVEVLRPLRWINAGVGMWVTLSPLIIAQSAAAAVNSVVVGLAVAALSLEFGRKGQDVGGGWPAVFRAMQQHGKERR